MREEAEKIKRGEEIKQLFAEGREIVRAGNNPALSEIVKHYNRTSGLSYAGADFFESLPSLKKALEEAANSPDLATNTKTSVNKAIAEVAKGISYENMISSSKPDPESIKLLRDASEHGGFARLMAKFLFISLPQPLSDQEIHDNANTKLLARAAPDYHQKIHTAIYECVTNQNNAESIDN